jgi:hypothetical protein
MKVVIGGLLDQPISESVASVKVGRVLVPT